MTRLVFPTDEHFPFQDEHARSVALQIVADFQPEVRIAGSDGLDFYALSKFDKDPHQDKKPAVGDRRVETRPARVAQRRVQTPAPST